MILKTRELQEKSTTELYEELAKVRKELFEARMKFYSRNLENSSLMRELRKSIARINTVLKQKETQA
jgi:large subunit ribosomal protein L29